ncbi:hypothetical protein [Bradyrhizobium sp. SEMIA]|uniref:hypothetical protein n=1 Tax=Bradyrhizobium sp. SEMIA TaxID=2597515 RepID=UPI0018A543E7|nr:hypothetical protein [Bradyrhizobium sp. SEMIA]QOG18891.1 hypothetical protein FOM02_17685 [Bradyrhizobium sp. SEMIA]
MAIAQFRRLRSAWSHDPLGTHGFEILRTLSNIVEFLRRFDGSVAASPLASD